MKKIIPLFLLLLLLCPRAWAEPEAVEAARAGVVQLYGLGTDRETGRRIRWTGTGFAVGAAGEESDIFLTNWHVATGSGRCEDGSVRLWLLREGARLDENQVPLPDSSIGCRVLLTTDGYPDVAVLQSEEQLPGCRALPLISSRNVTDGTQVYALGFAGLTELSGGAEDVTVTDGRITDRLIMTSAGNTRSIIHSAPIRHGFSGGPLVNAEGTVVAQNTYGFEEDVTTELFCAVYTDYGMELLEQLGIFCTVLPGQPAIVVYVANLLHMPSISPAAAYAIFAVGAVGVGAFVLYFLKTARDVFREWKKRRSEPDEEKEVP